MYMHYDDMYAICTYILDHLLSTKIRSTINDVKVIHMLVCFCHAMGVGCLGLSVYNGHPLVGV